MNENESGKPDDIDDLMEEEVDEIDTAALLAQMGTESEEVFEESDETKEPEPEEAFVEFEQPELSLGKSELDEDTVVESSQQVDELSDSADESDAEEGLGLGDAALPLDVGEVDGHESLFENEDDSLQELEEPVQEWDPEGSLKLEERLTTEAQVEAVVFAAPKPVKVAEILNYLDNEELLPKDIQKALDSLEKYYIERGGGFELANVGGGAYQFRSATTAGPIMERMFSNRPRALSRAAQETLAIVAYRQPVTRADIEFIRGVDAGSILKNLLDRELVACVGRKEDSGRPMLFGTTDEFLRTFQINDLKDLPPLESFQPSADAVQGAEQTLEKLEKGVEVQSFVDDEEGLSDPVQDLRETPQELN